MQDTTLKYCEMYNLTTLKVLWRVGGISGPLIQINSAVALLIYLISVKRKKYGDAKFSIPGSNLQWV